MKITERDTMECILADADGRWLGNGLGDIWDNKFLFKKNVKFQKPGTYEFVFNQAMRLDSLPMIMDAGISIEKSVVPPSPKQNWYESYRPPEEIEVYPFFFWNIATIERKEY